MSQLIHNLLLVQYLLFFICKLYVTKVMVALYFCGKMSMQNNMLFDTSL